MSSFIAANMKFSSQGRPHPQPQVPTDLEKTQTMIWVGRKARLRSPVVVMIGDDSEEQGEGSETDDESVADE